MNPIEVLRDALSCNPHGPEEPLTGELAALAQVETLIQTLRDIADNQWVNPRQAAREALAPFTDNTP